MGCGSSRSAVAVVENSESNSSQLPKQRSSIENFSAKCSVSESKIDSGPIRSSCNSLELLHDGLSKPNIDRDKSAGSVKSKDSGVFDENGDIRSSTDLQTQDSVNNNHTERKSTSARKKLLRIDGNIISTDNDQEAENNGISMISRPKTRFGNVAFDLVLDMPETGNMKKRPDKLPKLQHKRKKSKKIRTKEEIDRKIHEADERRRNQEMEKQLKAKQFQHLSVHTTVEPFHVPSEQKDSDDKIETVDENKQKPIVNSSYQTQIEAF